MTILDKIVEYKKKEVSENEANISVKTLEDYVLFERDVISLSKSLLDRNKAGIIAEFKRKSPSKGIINSDVRVDIVTTGYFREGASGVSVLTDNQFFGGSSSDLSLARNNNLVPILRKDFTINEYQVIESKAIGADAILLIAAILEKSEVEYLARLARSLGLEVLLEIHDKEELEKTNQYVNIIGVNNRNLKTFEVNTNISEEIAEDIPQEFIRISESGITSADIVKRLRMAGYNGFLIGEMFMRSPDPVRAFSEFVKDLI